jgi:hypothetical protein
MLLTAIFRASWMPLIGIPVCALWFAFWGMIFYIAGVEKTKEQMKIILEKARV